jgi:hypothetical protein
MSRGRGGGGVGGVGVGVWGAGGTKPNTHVKNINYNIEKISMVGNI